MPFLLQFPDFGYDFAKIFRQIPCICLKIFASSRSKSENFVTKAHLATVPLGKAKPENLGVARVYGITGGSIEDLTTMVEEYVFSGGVFNYPDGRDGNQLLYDKYKWLYDNGFIPKEPSLPPKD